MTCTRGTCVAPITSLCFSPHFLLAGEGAYLKVYSLSEYQLVNCERIFSGSNIHGIVKDPNSEDVFCIFGSKYIAVIQLGSCGSISVLSLECRLWDWIWCLQWLQKDSTAKLSSHLALALGHNVIVLWDWRERQCIQRVHCEEKCILYCAHFIGSTWEDLVLAAGTVFNQVIIWKPLGSGDGDRKVLHRLSGHQGVIFSIVYNAHKQLLCSTSDDRSIRVWHVAAGVSDDAPAVDWETTTFELQLVLYGHKARVWGAALLKDWIVTIGELVDPSKVIDMNLAFSNFSRTVFPSAFGYEGGKVLHCLHSDKFFQDSGL